MARHEDCQQGTPQVFVCRLQQVKDQMLHGGQSELVIMGHQR